MICPSCQSESSVHIFDPQAGQMVYYCQSCRKAIVPENSLKCPTCGISEYHFLSSGLCGCEDCYSVFRGSIIQGIESYRKQVFQKVGGYRLPASAAMARLQTYFEVFGTEGAEPPVGPVPNMDLELPNPSRQSEKLEAGEIQIRVRMARNIPGLPYREGMRKKSFLDRVFLSERGFLADALRWQGPAGIRLQTEIADEDHFRFSWNWISGPELKGAEGNLASIIRQIRRLDRAFVWQYSTIFGYQTACPTNSGSGLRMSARIPIPGLLADPSWLRWKKELHRAGFEVRPGSGEKSFPDGFHVQLATRFIPGPVAFRSVLERFRVYLGRLMVREERIAEKFLATKP